jgi:hypothetical protein
LSRPQQNEHALGFYQVVEVKDVFPGNSRAQERIKMRVRGLGHLSVVG